MTGTSPALSSDRRTLGQHLHEARRAVTDGRDRPWPVEEWTERDPVLQTRDEAMAAAVETVVRARVACELREMALHRVPGVARDALREAAVKVSRGGQDRSDEKEPQP